MKPQQLLILSGIVLVQIAGIFATLNMFSMCISSAVCALVTFITASFEKH